MIKKLVNILLALWLIVITTGVLVNSHFSRHALYASAIYLDAKSCCTLEEAFVTENQEAPAKPGDEEPCCKPTTESFSCCIQEDVQPKQIGLAYFEEESCCIDVSILFQLTEIFYPQKASIKVHPENSNGIALNLYTPKNPSNFHPIFTKTGPSPPCLKHHPIYIDIACYRC